MKRDFGIFFWIHLAFLIFLYSSPFWLDWRVILIVVVFLEIEFWILGGCFLTQIQFQRKGSFTGYYIKKVLPNFDLNDYIPHAGQIVPILIFLLSLYLQLVLRK